MYERSDQIKRNKKKYISINKSLLRMVADKTTEQKYSILGIYRHLFNENKMLFLQNVLLEAILPPMEIYLFTRISKTLLEDIKDKNTKFKLLFNSKNTKYFFLLVFLQYLYKYNREVINVLNKPIRLYVRKLLFEIKKKNQKMAISIVFMPLAIQNGYYSILKFILPVLVLFVYMLFIVCKYNKTVALVSILYVFCNLVYTMLQTKSLSSEAKEMFERHSDAINSYDDDNDNEIKTKEIGYEELRYKFNQGVNNFVFVQMVFYYLYASGLVYAFAKHRKKHCEMSSIVTMLLFIARYYNTILHRSKMFIESVARLRILRQRFNNTGTKSM